MNEENRQTGTPDGFDGRRLSEGEARAALADEVGGVEQRIGGQREELVELEGEKVVDVGVAAVLDDGGDVRGEILFPRREHDRRRAHGNPVQHDARVRVGGDDAPCPVCGVAGL